MCLGIPFLKHKKGTQYVDIGEGGGVEKILTRHTITKVSVINITK
jgi:hypothetical protein